MFPPQTNTLKRNRSDEDDEEEVQGFRAERRIARAKDNNVRATTAARVIPPNKISSSSIFNHNQTSSPLRRRSNATARPQSQANMTPYPSDTEETYRPYVPAKLPEFAKITAPPSLRQRARQISHGHPFSSSQDESWASSQGPGSPANSVIEDSGMALDDSMDLDMDDAPTFSQGSSSPSQYTSFDKSLSGFGSPIAQAISAHQYSRRLPSPISDDDDQNMMSPGLATELENFGQMGMQLDGARQEVDGTWRVGGRSASGTMNWGHVATMPDKNVGAGQGAGGNTAQRMVMGYRADCEKCVNRVPGHYMHII